MPPHFSLVSRLKVGSERETIKIGFTTCENEQTLLLLFVTPWKLPSMRVIFRATTLEECSSSGSRDRQVHHPLDLHHQPHHPQVPLQMTAVLRHHLLPQTPLPQHLLLHPPQAIPLYLPMKLMKSIPNINILKKKKSSPQLNLILHLLHPHPNRG